VALPLREHTKLEEVQHRNHLELKPNQVIGWIENYTALRSSAVDEETRRMARMAMWDPRFFFREASGALDDIAAWRGSVIRT